MVTVYVLAVAAYSVPFGRIADIVGIKKIIIIGTIIYTLSSTIALFSNSSIMLIICRSIQGGERSADFGQLSSVNNRCVSRRRKRPSPRNKRNRRIFRFYCGAVPGRHINRLFWLEKHISHKYTDQLTGDTAIALESKG